MIICRFLNIMMPENLSDEINVLKEYGGDMFDDNIDPNLRRLLDETKDFIHRYLKKFIMI